MKPHRMEDADVVRDKSMSNTTNIVLVLDDNIDFCG